MTDLSKLPWDECVLPRFNGQEACVGAWKSSGGFSCCEICCSDNGTLATQVYYDHKRWEFPGKRTTDEIELINHMCCIVELFIKRHTEQRPTICEPESCTTNKGEK